MHIHVAAPVDEVRLGYIQYKPIEESIENHNDVDDFLLVLPLRHGRVRLERDGGIFFDGTVKPGTVRFVQPGERAQMLPQSEFDSIMLQIPGDAFRVRASAQGLTIEDGVCPELMPVLQSHHAVQRLVPLLGNTSELPVPQRRGLIDGVTTALLALLLDPDLFEHPDSEPGFDDEQYAMVMHFAETRLSEHLDLGEWAEAVGLPAAEFARRFQHHTGVAPYSWFMDRRVEEAKHLMSHSERPLAEVALDSGFCSQSHFTEAFRRRVGVSPGRWRKDHCQD